MSQMFAHTRTRTLPVPMCSAEVLVKEAAPGSVSSGQLQVPEDGQQGAQQREHGAETRLFWQEQQVKANYHSPGSKQPSHNV